MTGSRLHLLSFAGRLGVIGGSLGIAAGIAQVTIGSRIPDWSGDKHQPVALGLLTIVLSASAIAASRAVRVADAPHSPATVGVAVWLVIVAAVCSTTVGRLWVIPGLVLLAAVGVTLTACGWHRFRVEITTHWLRGLLGLLGAFELLMAVSAAPAATIANGVLGGAALIAAAVLATPDRRVVVGALVAASVPFAIVTWWAVVPPLLTVVALAIGITVTRRDAPRHDLPSVASLELRPLG